MEEPGAMFADIWSRAALIDTRNFTTLISPWASISDFNLDRPTESTWRPGDKNYCRRCSFEFFRLRFLCVGGQFSRTAIFTWQCAQVQRKYAEIL